VIIPPLLWPRSTRSSDDTERLFRAMLMDVLKVFYAAGRSADRYTQHQAACDEAWIRSDVEYGKQYFPFVYVVEHLGLDAGTVRRQLLQIRAQTMIGEEYREG
jgi:hypothetical protein